MIFGCEEPAAVVDRRRTGCGSGSSPLSVSLTGGNRNDVTQLLPLIDKVPPVRGRRARPRRRPDDLFADRAYDHGEYGRPVWAKGIRPRIARRDRPHGSGLTPLLDHQSSWDVLTPCSVVAGFRSRPR